MGGSIKRSEEEEAESLPSVCFFPGLQAAWAGLKSFLHYAPATTLNFMVYLLHSAHGTDYS